ncbi:hypothetical protein CHS0354_032286 [Potamilus streckersoni]|uniref:Uncharacterized protein n=1 Tax=Potamilus streckersoni TaxID=2493646 RepID=A0AAE0RPV4_9BIVA|nr:hypothetical protein CHS0354_032286 [Potamilus streckersoni]
MFLTPSPDQIIDTLFQNYDFLTPSKYHVNGTEACRLHDNYRSFIKDNTIEQVNWCIASGSFPLIGNTTTKKSQSVLASDVINKYETQNRSSSRSRMSSFDG